MKQDDKSTEEIIKEFRDNFDLRQPTSEEMTEQTLSSEKVGDFYLYNPGAKEPGNLMQKLNRKAASELQNEGVASPDHDYLIDHEATHGTGGILDEISDYARCTVAAQDFTSAVEVAKNLIRKMGGKIKIRDKETYKAIHWNGQIGDLGLNPNDPENGDINAEVQITTVQGLRVKKITDDHYHKWCNLLATDPEATKANPDYQKERQAIIDMCDVIYGRTDFATAKPQFEELAEKWNGKIPPMKRTQFVLLTSQASVAQEKLLESVRDILKEIELTKDANLEAVASAYISPDKIH